MKPFHKITVEIPNEKDCTNCRFVGYDDDLKGYACALFSMKVSYPEPCPKCPNYTKE